MPSFHSSYQKAVEFALLYFLHRTLPWMGLHYSDPQTKYRMIGEKRLAVDNIPPHTQNYRHLTSLLIRIAAHPSLAVSVAADTSRQERLGE